MNHSVSCTRNLRMQSVLRTHTHTHTHACTLSICLSLIVQDWGTPSSRRKVLSLYSYIILWFRQAPFVTHDPQSIRSPAEPPTFTSTAVFIVLACVYRTEVTKTILNRGHSDHSDCTVL